MTKLKKKEKKTQINFLQETHLSKAEHEKFGFKNTFYSSHSNAQKRGVAIFMSNVIKLERKNRPNNKGGNIYTPPESSRDFF